MNEYTGNDNHGKPKSEYVNKIKQMSKEKLMEETERKIWLSAYANNNPRSDYHWHVDVCYDEWINRDGNADNYQKAWKKVARQ